MAAPAPPQGGSGEQVEALRSSARDSRKGEGGDGTAPPPDPEVDLDHAEPFLRANQPGAPAPVIPAQAGIQGRRHRVFDTGYRPSPVSGPACKHSGVLGHTAIAHAEYEHVPRLRIADIGELDEMPAGRFD